MIKIVDNTLNSGYHALTQDIPLSVLKKMRDGGKISMSDYNKLRKGKIMMDIASFGNVESFAIECKMFKAEHETEMAMYMNGKNILAFKRGGEVLTTRWNLDDIAEWMRRFLNNMREDPYPVKCSGAYAAIKDIEARDFASDDDGAFDAYYDKLDKWNESHRWHLASNGAILADVYFQLCGDEVEISWNNQDAEVSFIEVLGGTSVSKDVFTSVVDDFLKFYAEYWF